MSTRSAILVGNWYGDKYIPNARASVIAASKRWGVDFVELLKPVAGHSPFVEKLHLDEHARRHGVDHAVYYDRDVVIRSDCPSPFETFPRFRFGATCSFQSGHDFTGESEQHLGNVFRSEGRTFDPKQDHCNGGFYAFDDRSGSLVFGTARRLADRYRDPHWSVMDEGLVSLAMVIRRQLGEAEPDKTTIVRYSSEWNRCGPAQWAGEDAPEAYNRRDSERWSPVMETYVYHYCGGSSQRQAVKYERIARTIWKL